jgi:hypothetical protein
MVQDLFYQANPTSHSVPQVSYHIKSYVQDSEDFEGMCRGLPRYPETFANLQGLHLQFLGHFPMQTSVHPQNCFLARISRILDI